jgi:hypothetical protein
MSGLFLRWLRNDDIQEPEVEYIKLFYPEMFLIIVAILAFLGPMIFIPPKWFLRR